MSIFFQAYPLLRPALFALDAETAHEATLSALQKAYDCRATRTLLFAPETAAASAPSQHLMGLPLRNRVGLAAGLDKNGTHIDALGALGFGFMEIGTVTPRAQPGNPRPRLFRLPQAQALINRMGFNNQGLAAFVDNVRRNRWQAGGGVLGLNIGKNKDTPQADAINDYLLGLAGVYAHADYVCVNISSPNTAHLRDLQQHEELSRLLSALIGARQSLADVHGKHVPLAVKIAPDLDDEALARVADVITAHGVEGVIATNTTVARDAIAGHRTAGESGGLSGAPLKDKATHVLRELRARLPASIPLIGVGGITTGADAAEKIAAGASLVQCYSGLVYRGPALIQECVQAIRASIHA